MWLKKRKKFRYTGTTTAFDSARKFCSSMRAKLQPLEIVTGSCICNSKCVNVNEFYCYVKDATS